MLPLFICGNIKELILFYFNMFNFRYLVFEFAAVYKVVIFEFSSVQGSYVMFQ